MGLPAGARSHEAWADSQLASIKAGITAARQAEEAVAAERAARVAATRAAAQAKAEDVRRRQMRHVLFTEPAEPVAGQDVTIFYNPQNTLLAGRDAVFLRGGFNRWRHARGVGPLRMDAPAGEGHHHKVRACVTPL